MAVFTDYKLISGPIDKVQKEVLALKASDPNWEIEGAAKVVQDQKGTQGTPPIVVQTLIIGVGS